MWLGKSRKISENVGFIGFSEQKILKKKFDSASAAPIIRAHLRNLTTYRLYDRLGKETAG